MFGLSGKPRNVQVGTILAALGLGLAVFSVAMYIFGDFGTKHHVAFHLVTLGLWLVVPPLWFVLESVWMVNDRTDPSLVRTQELLSKVWAGISALLAGLAAYR
jgi:hypothetical protein